ncbi:MAG: hypothetical protein QM533_04350 [Cytophagales bacterium]|nr:hypothetical protein [Cytophagales bacterium]
MSPHKNTHLFLRNPVVRCLLGLLWVGYLWLQLAGTVHRYEHANGTQIQSISAATERLLPAHENAAACQLFDLICTGLALAKTLPSVTVSISSDRHQNIVFLSISTLHWYAYKARAPPALI